MQFPQRWRNVPSNLFSRLLRRGIRAQRLFVDSSGQIREDFLSFIKMEGVRAADIEDAIIKLLQDVGLSPDFLRGQGYDGASTMSGEREGVQKRILDRQPKAL